MIHKQYRDSLFVNFDTKSEPYNKGANSLRQPFLFASQPASTFDHHA